MKALKLFIVIFLVGTRLMPAATLAQRLIEVNANWADYPALLRTYNTPAHQLSDAELIQTHLLAVHKILSASDISHLNEQQRRNRQKSLEQLYQYALRGDFPQNLVFNGRIPVFIDPRGVHCAVGYLIAQSGHQALSSHISANMNFCYIRDMHDPALKEWIAQSGFTANELAWIQPAYFQPINYQPLKDGTNGSVNTIISDNNGGVYAGGQFDTAGQIAAGNLANYFSGFAGFDWMGLGTIGVDGPVNDLIFYHGELYVAGNFFNADTVVASSGVVKWDGTQWQAVGEFYVGALNSFVNDLEVYHDTLYAGGFFRSVAGAPEYFESIAKWDGTSWVASGIQLTGEVRKLHVFNNKLVVAGDFWLNTGAPIKNICQLNGNAMEYFPRDIPLPVYDLATFQNELYAATDFTNPSQLDTMGLAVFRNGNWQVLFKGGYQPNLNNHGIRALAATQQRLFFGGDFKIAPLIGNYGKNMGFYNGAQIEPFGYLDSTVRTLTVIDDFLFVGGDFTMTNQIPANKVSHIAEVYLPPYLGLPDPRLSGMQLYPNPTRDYLTLEEGLQLKQIEIVDLQGRRQKFDTEKQGKKLRLNLESLAAGTYILQATMEGNPVQAKIVKW